jgi:hypothetical protein
MPDTTLPALLGTGDHASRPAAGDVGSGALYSCTDHSLVYQSDGSSWTTWATLGGASVEPPTLQRTTSSRAGNITTGSTTFVIIDNTKLPAISVANCEVGDVIEMELTGQSYNSGANAAFIDWQVDRPVGATVRVSPGPNDSGVAVIGAATTRNTTFARAQWVIDESGTHTFQPMWRCTAGTQTFANAASGSDDTMILHTVKRWPAALVL